MELSAIQLEVESGMQCRTGGLLNGESKAQMLVAGELVAPQQSRFESHAVDVDFVVEG